MVKRSRGGCWTCKRRHKKCDEARPLCKRCIQAGMVCEGYDVRLTWGSSGEDTEKTGTFSRPVRQSRSQRSRISQSKAKATSVSNHTQRHASQCYSPGTSDLLQLIWGTNTLIGLDDLPSPEIEAELLQDFVNHGFLTLIGRTKDVSLIESDIIPLLDCCIPLRHTSLAYQASISKNRNHLAPLYLQAALSAHLDNLTRPEALGLDTTLATGVLLCSASITSLYIWTPLLTGLHGLLEHRGLLNTAPRPKLVNHLVEVIGILDIECFTLNRLSAPLNVWKTYIAPTRQSGIEESSGLPYTLVNLLADLESPHVEDQLIAWMGEKADDFLQIHLWEATRAAAILQCRALRTSSPNPDAQQSGPSKHGPAGDYLQMKVFASIKALINSDTFHQEHPMADLMLYPLFIGCIFTEQNTAERDQAPVIFQNLIGNSEWQNHQVLWDIIVEVWERAKSRPDESRLALANEFAGELNIEIYLC